jgi:uncharacterized damage-inducible protein DinB
MSAAMVTPDWVRMMATYNAAMNRRIYDAAGQLDDAARKLDRGAFFGSIHATLNHLLWGDRMWMARFAGWEKPAQTMQEGIATHATFPALTAARAETDAKIADWADRVGPEWLAGELTWFSGAVQREVKKPRGMLVTHMFNHQTHHRGQVHAMLTAAGVRPADTDLFIVLEG